LRRTSIRAKFVGSSVYMLLLATCIRYLFHMYLLVARRFFLLLFGNWCWGCWDIRDRSDHPGGDRVDFGLTGRREDLDITSSVQLWDMNGK